MDEFLLAIQNNITALLEDKEINANDYNVSFKSEKAQGAGTLLVDVCDFENFKSEYIKLAAAKKVVLILITMKKKEKIVKRKKKVNLYLLCKFFLLYIFRKKLTIWKILIRNLIQIMKKQFVMNQFQRPTTVIKFQKYQISLYLIKELQKMLQSYEKKLGILCITDIA